MLGLQLGALPHGGPFLGLNPLDFFALIRPSRAGCSESLSVRQKKLSESPALTSRFLIGLIRRPGLGERERVAVQIGNLHVPHTVGVGLDGLVPDALLGETFK